MPIPPSRPDLRIVMAQLNLLVGDIKGNATRIAVAAQDAVRDHQADLIIFPELSLTGYPPEDLLYRSELYHRVDVAIKTICDTVQGIAVVLGYPRRTPAGVYNAAGVIQDGELRHEYYKHELPNYGVFDEKRYFIPGHATCVFKVRDVAIGVSICEDVWHPSVVQRSVTDGAQIMINLNASPFHAGKTRIREKIIRDRVSDVRVPLVYVNLVGGQDELVFDGESFVMDSNGQLVTRAAAFREEIVAVDFVKTTGGLQVVPGKLTQELQAVESVYSALVLGVRDYIYKNGFKGAVLGLSGGIDSALTLCIAVDAISAANVQVLSMPSRYTASMSIEDARAQASSLGVEIDVVPIESIFMEALAELEPVFRGAPADTTEENMQARIRGLLLMAVSNKIGRLVLTTGNKSEVAVGYCTLYGDMVGGYSVLKDVPKTLVYELAAYRNKIAEVIPQRVITRAPSAELALDQKDEDNLPPYAILDPIIELYVEQDLGYDDIVAKGFDGTTVRKVLRLIDLNEYKRRQAAPGVRISSRAFGRDRRFPITSGFSSIPEK